MLLVTLVDGDHDVLPLGVLESKSGMPLVTLVDMTSTCSLWELKRETEKGC